MPSKSYSFDIKPVHFVYETEFHKLRQPFFSEVYYMHLITKGSAVLKIGEERYPLARGDIFFAFAALLYEIEGSEDFEYMYISFMGSGAAPLLESLDITSHKPVHRVPDELIGFWQSAINRITRKNITVLTEGVLYYTLSYMGGTDKSEQVKITDSITGRIVDYIDRNYCDPDMSLQKLASIFSYTEKYLSALIKKNLNTTFRHYLNRLRIQYALTLIESGETSVSSLSAKCGYTDPTYFGKVFKTIRGITPSVCIHTYGK